MFDLSYFLSKIFVGNDGFQSMFFFYQPTFNTLELKEDKCNEYVIGWKLKGEYTSKLIPFHYILLCCVT